MNTSLAAAVFFIVYVCMSLFPDEYEGYALYVALGVSMLAVYVDQETDVSEIATEAITDSILNVNDSSKSIKFGASLPLNSKVGVNIVNGINAAFTSVNISGGINKRKIELISKNDNNMEIYVHKNTKTILEENEDLLGFVSPIGYDMTKTMLDATSSNGTACKMVISPFSMHSDLRGSNFEYYNNIINLAGYNYDSFSYFIGYFHDKLGLKTFGVFSENNIESNNNVDVLKYTLKRRGLGLVSQGTYETMTPRDINFGFNDSIAASPKVIFVFSDIDYVCLDYINRCRTLGLTSLIVFIGLHSQSFISKIPVPHRYGIFFSSNIPDLNNIKLEVVTKFKRDILLVESFNSNKVNRGNMLIEKDNYISFYGYLVGMYIIKILETMAKEDESINVSSFNEAVLNTKNVVIGNDYIYEFFGNTNQALTYMFLYEVFETTNKPIEYTPEKYYKNASELFKK